MNEHFRIGVVGLGEWARRAYLPNVELMGDVEVAALSTRSAENLEAALALVTSQPQTYSDYRAMLEAGELDGVIVSSAAPSHREIAEAALRAGYPVLCEKPLALTIEDCDALDDVAKESGSILQVGLEFRHAPVFVLAVEQIRKGRIGAPSLAECRIFRDKRKSISTAPGKWTRYGGVFLEFLCHYLDVVTWLCDGEPKAVSAACGQQLGTEAWDFGAIQVEHGNGAVGNLNFGLFAPPEAETVSFRVLGETGSLELSFGTGEVTLSPASGAGQPETLATPPPSHPSKPYPGSYEQIAAFVEAARSGGPSPVDARLWKQVMAVGMAAERGVVEKRRVALG